MIKSSPDLLIFHPWLQGWIQIRICPNLGIFPQIDLAGEKFEGKCC